MTNRTATASNLFAAIAGQILDTGLVVEGTDRLAETVAHRFISRAAQAVLKEQSPPRRQDAVCMPPNRRADPL